MKRRKIVPWIIVFVIIAGLAVVKFSNIRQKNERIAKMRGKQTLHVDAFIISNTTFKDYIHSTGSVMANRSIALRPETAGTITKINFQEGNKVKKGQLLVKLFDKDLRAQLRKLKVQKQLAETNKNRLSKLLEIQGVSQQQYDVAVNKLNTIKADIQLVKAQLSKTVIRAPFTGIIGLQNFYTGAYVTSQDIITTLQDLEPLLIDFSVPGQYLSQIKPNTKIPFTVAGFSDTFQAKLYAISPKIDLQTRTIRLRAKFNNTSKRLLPGLFAKIRLPVATIQGAVFIPSQSVVPNIKGQKVFYLKNGHIAQKPIEIGIRNDTAVQVVYGLSPKDTILTTGLLRVKPGDKVKLKTISAWN